MGEASEIVTLIFAATMAAALGFEIKRRQKKLRAIYDVLDAGTRQVTAELEDMIQKGELKPFKGETWE